MKVLIACEESQTVCKAFRNLGHEAYSCDILECSGGHPEWHIQDDVFNHIDRGWDLMIAHPPCDHLASSGARWFEEKRKDGRQQAGIDFFMKLVEADVPRICVENPIGIMSSVYRKPDQIVHPFHFGDSARKSTCLWLKELPLLVPTNIVDEGEIHVTKSGRRLPKWYNIPPIEGRAKIRSKFFEGMANAMAQQWSNL